MVRNTTSWIPECFLSFRDSYFRINLFFFSSFSFSAFRIFTVVFVVVFLCFRVFIFQRYKNGVRAESMAQMDGKKTWRRARVNLNK